MKGLFVILQLWVYVVVVRESISDKLARDNMDVDMRYRLASSLAILKVYTN
jgi:hypothetical protein